MKTEIGPSNIHRQPEPADGFAVWIEDGVWYTAPKVDPLKFGKHDYDIKRTGTGQCRCGCYMGRSSSSGPVDPFGACPSHPRGDTHLPI